MPRAKKEVEKIDVKEVSKATSTVKKAAAKKSKTPAKKVSKSTKTEKSAAKLDNTVLKTTKEKSVKKSKTTTKKASSSKTSKARKTKIAKVPSLATKRRTKSVSKEKETKKDFAHILEYYDLPYRYNETVVKILAQTPKILFVYWDISDSDREKYVEKYGEYFFNDTYPVLIVHNKTLNYSQEIEINDFANSWYIHLPDSRSEYYVELGRRFKEYAKRNPEMPHKEEINSVIPVSSSNDLIMPNDHVLLEEIKPQVKYRNVKTNEETFKNTTRILANNKLIDFYNLYKELYQVEDLSSFFTYYFLSCCFCLFHFKQIIQKEIFYG